MCTCCDSYGTLTGVSWPELDAKRVESLASVRHDSLLVLPAGRPAFGSAEWRQQAHAQSEACDAVVMLSSLSVETEFEALAFMAAYLVVPNPRFVFRENQKTCSTIVRDTGTASRAPNAWGRYLRGRWGSAPRS